MPDQIPTKIGHRNDEEPVVPQVRDMRTKILGLLPKDAQARVLGGIALIMVLVIVFSGRKTPPVRPAIRPAPEAATIDVNQARIQEYRARIDEQAQKLALEEARLNATRQAFGGPTGASGAEVLPAKAVNSSIRTNPMAEFPRPQPEKSWIEVDREKREYQGLYESNIALSYRTAPVPAMPRTGPPVEPDASAVPKSRTAAAPEFRLLEGTVLETVLTNRLDSSFSGPVNCMVTTDVYSHDHQALLIPQGSRVLGKVRKLQSLGEQRLAVTYHRLIMPDGYSVSLDQFEGLNQIGETGLRDQVNHHYLQIFGASLAIGAIAGLAQGTTRYGLDQSAADTYEQGVASSLSQSSLRILDRYLNILPTFTIREGHRIKVYLSQDLKLPAYTQHPA
jgi:type IV secretion system protein VirB10